MDLKQNHASFSKQDLFGEDDPDQYIDESGEFRTPQKMS